jgi:antitoxin VapB
MIKTKTFMTGRSQAIRLPKEYRFNEDELYINKIDGVLMVVPKAALWKIFEASLDKFSEDFMNDRGFDIKDSRDQL